MTLTTKCALETLEHGMSQVLVPRIVWYRPETQLLDRLVA